MCGYMLDTITSAEIDREIDINVNSFRSIRFVCYTGLGYSWVAKDDNGSRVHPKMDAYQTKFFKTLTGAKRNFIKQISEQVK